MTSKLQARTMARDEDGNRHQGPSKPRRRMKCGMCPACIASDCGKCRACQDMPKFGVPNRMKQGCFHRKCQVWTQAQFFSGFFMQKVPGTNILLCCKIRNPPTALLRHALHFRPKACFFASTNKVRKISIFLMKIMCGRILKYLLTKMALSEQKSSQKCPQYRSFRYN